MIKVENVEEEKLESTPDDSGVPLEEQKPHTEPNDLRPKYCLPNFYPSQNLFEFDDGVIIDSKFDSGNLAGANKVDKFTVLELSIS